jgi:hypothetical protein
MFVLFTAAGLCDVSGQQPKLSTAPILVQISEVEMNLSPNGGVTSGCVLVQPDGHLHLEHGEQHLPKSITKRTIFTARLSKGQMQALRNVLDKQDIQNLSPFVPPVPPVGVGNFRVFGANIAREVETQRVGFFTWEGQGLSNVPPNSSPDDVKRAWQISATVLQPLVDWFHALQGMKLRRSHAKPTLCGLDADEHN